MAMARLEKALLPFEKKRKSPMNLFHNSVRRLAVHASSSVKRLPVKGDVLAYGRNKSIDNKGQVYRP
jgi:hypothetical protein